MILVYLYAYFMIWVNQVYVANHTSMIDFIVLEQMTAFAVIMQKHPGWVGKSQAVRARRIVLMTFMIAQV